MNQTSFHRTLAQAILITSGLLLSTPQTATAFQNPSAALPQGSSDKPVGYANWPLKTTGGLQFWTDWKNVGGWRIQENSETGHFRLVDGDDVRRAWGNCSHCQLELNRRLAAGKVNPAKGRVVILLHGLVRTSNSMNTMESYLKNVGYSTVNFGYASSRKKVCDHAAALKSVIDGLGNEVTDIYFVAHSLGNIVIRRYLHETENHLSGGHGDSRIRRIVMIGPPNQGSKVAQAFKNSQIFRICAGQSGDQLARDWDKLEPKLTTPKVEFGIIAGGQSGDMLGNPLIRGKDDYTVSTEETKLIGASDFLVRPLLHGTMMNQPLVLEATARFFQHGYFVSKAERTPLLKIEMPTQNAGRDGNAKRRQR
jgi:pimeloyl-ACP methyl ester carboxylesterase